MGLVALTVSSEFIVTPGVRRLGCRRLGLSGGLKGAQRLIQYRQCLRILVFYLSSVACYRYEMGKY